MVTINLKDGGHTWEKQNVVTITTRRGSFDIMKCTGCGITGKTASLVTIRLKQTYGNKINNCPAAMKVINAQKERGKIQITYCHAMGKQFANLTPGSEHDVVAAPEGQKEDTRGVWVMGVGEPVKVLNDEFKKI
jgi:hypothetical protein